jgi:two-component system, sensor histidine kinase and response regulator
LHSLGFQADAVSNGREAVNALKTKNYEVVLMDCNMPEMDGFEATREIRLLENGKNSVKIIAMTANALVGEEESCLKYGMDDYLSKPMLKEQLLKVLTKHLYPVEKKLDSGTNFVQHRLEDILDKQALENLREIEVRGEKNFVAETIKLYLSHAEKQIEEIKQAISSKNGNDLYLKAHGLKGSSGSIGLTGMYKLCEELETQSQTDNLYLSEQILNKLLPEFDKIKLVLAGFTQ